VSLEAEERNGPRSSQAGDNKKVCEHHSMKSFVNNAETPLAMQVTRCQRSPMNEHKSTPLCVWASNECKIFLYYSDQMTLSLTSECV